MDNSLTIDGLLKELEQYKAAYSREKKARQESEKILDHQMRELYYTNCELKKINDELVKHQKSQVQFEKLAALGTLSAGMAHEVNNPLAFVISNISNLRKYFEIFTQTITEVSHLEDVNKDTIKGVIDQATARYPRWDMNYLIDDSQQIFSAVNHGLERVRDIVSNLKNFSRSNNSEKSAHNVNDSIDSALKLLSSHLKKDVSLNVNLAEDLPDVYCNANQLSQVVLNLAINGIYATQKEDAPTLNVTTLFEDGLVKIIVEDNGFGIKSEVVDNIFVPFFTTKPMGEGTGLGLSISYGIIQDMEGSITVDTEYGSGAKFTIALPPMESKA